MNSLKSVNGSYAYKEEMLYCMDFGLLGFNDWTDLNDDGLTWGAQYTDNGLAVMIYLYYDKCYGIHLAEDYVPDVEIFATDDMGELWSIIKSNLKYFDQLLTKERG
jgi:hypothetical protein